ncbi:MAG: hypothetical protein R3B55_01770 [Candidatus Paceibacterota bacterium]
MNFISKIKNFKLLFLLILIIGGFVIFNFNKKEIISSETSNFRITIVPAPQCFDGQDNDSDGLIDFPNDPGCASYTDDSESDFTPPPSGGGGGGGGGTRPPETGVSFSGRAYPLSRVTILKDGVVVVETIAGQDARFRANIGDLNPGSYNFTVRATDENGVTGNPFSFPVFISQGSTTDVTGIFLAPTIDVDKAEVRKGDDIAIFGQTVPESDVTIEVNSENQFFVNTQSDGDGIYLYNFNSAPLEEGSHSARSKTNLNTGEASNFGKLVGFSVGDQNIPKVPGNDSCRADLNQDGKVNLVDFSIAAFWYNKPLSGEITITESNCLNADGKINLVDFSIIAFNWTG